MEKVVLKEYRKEHTIKLPESGVTLVCYSSLLVKDLPSGVSQGNELDSNLEIILKLVKEWNLYLSEADEKPADITVENFKMLPSADFTYLVEQLKDISIDQKKS